MALHANVPIEFILGLKNKQKNPTIPWNPGECFRIVSAQQVSKHTEGGDPERATER